jgi:hypothetical protein
VHKVREHRHDRQNLGREHHFFDEVAARNQDVRRFDERRLKPRPRQQPAEEEEREVWNLLHLRRRHDIGEHECVNQQEQ